MSIVSPVVSSMKTINSVHATVEGAIHPVGVVYTFINGERKKVWPDPNPTTQPTVEYTTAGTHTITLAPGVYKFTVNGAGGGSILSRRTPSHTNAAVAVGGGGSGAYGTFTLTLNTQETFTFSLGAGGNNSKSEGSGAVLTAGTGGTTTISSNIRGQNFVVLNPGTGGSGATYSDSRNNWASGGTGGSFSTTLTTDNTFYNGKNGTGAEGYSGTTYYGNGGDNPDPYKGDGSAVAYDYGDKALVYQTTASSGYVKIEPATQYIYLSPITSSISLEAGRYYFEIVGAGAGGMGVYGAGYYAYANGGSAASAYGYFDVANTETYNIQVGTGGAGVSTTASTTGSGTLTASNGTSSYITRASDGLNIITCGGGTAASWHYDGSHSSGEYFVNYPQGGTYSTDLTSNITAANGLNGTTAMYNGDEQVNLTNVYTVFFEGYGTGGYGRRLYVTGASHEGGRGSNGMLKIYKVK